MFVKGSFFVQWKAQTEAFTPSYASTNCSGIEVHVELQPCQNRERYFVDNNQLLLVDNNYGWKVDTVVYHQHCMNHNIQRHNRCYLCCLYII